MGGELMMHRRGMPEMFGMNFAGPPMGPGAFAIGGGPMIGPVPCFPPFGLELNLSDDQLEAIHKKRNELLAKSEPLKAELKIAESSFFDALSQPNVDKEQVRQLQAKTSNLRSQLAALFTEHMLSVSDVLTLEQRKKVRQSVIKGPMPGGGSAVFRTGPAMHGDRPPPPPRD
jgi:hypothetical protein